MRTEYKIGIAVALFVAVLACLYLFRNHQGSNDQPRGPEITKKPSGDGNNQVRPIPDRARVSAVAPSSPLAPGADASRHPDAIASASGEPTTRTAASLLPARATQPADSAHAGLGSIAEPSARLVPADSARPPAPQTYTVKEGDKGLWSIAAKVYGEGKGKYWNLIANANSNLNLSPLRPGTVLKIPPLPKEVGASVDLAKAEASAKTAATPGGHPYVVQEDDKGFWLIAQKVYGDGRFFTEIAKANPGVNAQHLRVGQKIILPDIPGVAMAKTDSAASERSVAHNGGEKYYQPPPIDLSR